MTNDITPELRGADLGNQYALHALRERRAEMAGEMTQLLERVRYLKQAIHSLDGTLAIMAPGCDPSTIRPKRPRTKAKLFGAGKLNALIYDALRKGDRPMSLVEVCEAIGEAVGFGPKAVVGLRSRVRSALLYLTKVRGTVIKEGEREAARWLISSNELCG